MKLITTLMLLMILNFSAISQQVINFGVSDQITMCSDGYIDDAGNSIVLMYNEVSGFMIGSFDPYFNTNWITSFGIGSGSAGKLIRLSNGDFFGFTIQDTSGRGHVFKFDSHGNIYWHKVLDNNSNISECIELSNQNIAVLAQYGATPVYLVFDANGVLQFSKTMSDGDIGNRTFYDVIKTNDGHYLLIGGCSSSYHDKRLMLTKIDADFNQIWTKSFEYDGINNVVNNSIQDVANDYYLVGWTLDTSSLTFSEYDFSILKFDSVGNYYFGKSYGSQFRDIAEDIEPGPFAKSVTDNLTIIGKSKPTESCGENLLVVSINGTLDTLFTKHYGHSTDTGTSFTELHSKNDSLYTFGSHSLWSNIGPSDGHLIKTDHTFDMECEYYKSGLEYSSDLHLTEITNPFVFSNTSISLINCTTTSTSTSGITIRDACNGMTFGNSENEQIKFELYPNPASSSIYLHSEFNFDNVTICDLLGKSVLEVNDVHLNHLAIDLSPLKKGSYIVVIQVNSILVRKKIILI